MPTLPIPTRFNFKTMNITMVADGLSTSAINVSIFSELGAAKSSFQVPQIAVVDFGKYNATIVLDRRMAVVSDATGEASIASPIPEMMSQIIAATPNIRIEGIGFNYNYELLVDGAALVLTERFLRKERFAILGDLQSAGVKVVCKNDHVITLSVDPVWEQTSVLNIALNHHFAGPDSAPVLARFKDLTLETPDLLKKVMNGA